MVLGTPVNPRKKFNFGVEFEGLEKALVQRITIPSLEIDVAEHGAGNILIKTGGMVKVGDLELNKLMFLNKNENWAVDWFNSVSNMQQGSVGVPSEYKRNGYIIFYDTDQESVLEKWQVIGAFPKMIEHDELDKSSSEDIIQKVTLSVDYVIRSS